MIVNDTHWDIDKANVMIVDATELKLGMSLRVAGRLSTDLSRGTATSIMSAAELRGPVSNESETGFEVLGVRVSTDETTVYQGLGANQRIQNGTQVQIYGLPTSDGRLQATRIERLTGPAPSPVVTGAIQQLNSALGTFRIGSLTVSYAGAASIEGVAASGLANGQIVRVRANQGPTRGVLAARSVQSWYALNVVPDGTRLSISGVVTDFADQADFKVQGFRVNGANTNVTGGPARNLANGARVEVSGTVRNSVLVLDKLRLRSNPVNTRGGPPVGGPPAGGPPQVGGPPGGGAAPAGDPPPATYSVSGNIAQFDSVADFMVQGQSIDASGRSVTFINGTAAQLARRQWVTVTGSRVVAGFLIAETVTFRD